MLPGIIVEPDVKAPRAAGAPSERLGVVFARAQLMVSSLSIRYKIAGAFIAVLCLALAGHGYVAFRMQRDVLREEMQRRAEVLAQQVASAAKTAILAREELAIVALLKDLTREAHLRYAVVLDETGKPFAQSPGAASLGLLHRPEHAAALKADRLQFRSLELRGEPVLDASAPVVSGFNGRRIRVGTVRVGLSEQPLVEAVERQQNAFFWTTGAFILFGLVIALLLGRVLTYPLLMLAMGMKVVARGDLSSRVRVDAKDEIGRLAEIFNDMVLKLQEKLRMERYLSQSTLDLIRNHGNEPRLGGERRHLSVLFSDIRGFTQMSETMQPEEVVHLINIYLNLQAEVISRLGGTVDKFVGDQVMAVFTGKDAEMHAARAALEIQTLVRRLNEARRRSRKQEVWVGIGVNSGEAVMGNIGSVRQMDYTVIGDVINTAARICHAASRGQIILSPTVADALGTRALTRRMEPLILKGKANPVQVCELLELPGPRRVHYRRPVDLTAHILGGGILAQEARVRDLGEGGCVLETRAPEEVGAKIELRLGIEGLGRLDGVRAQVRHVRRSGERYLIGLRFENLTDDERGRLTEFAHEV